MSEPARTDRPPLLAGGMRLVAGWVTTPSQAAVAGLCLAMSCYILWVAFRGVPPAFWHRTLFLGFLLLVTFIEGTRQPRPTWWRVLNGLLAATAAAAIGYMLIDYQALVQRTGRFHTLDIVVGGIVFVLVLEATRRAIGWVIPGLALLGLAYAMFGPYMPGPVAHRGFDLDRIIGFQVLTLDGLLGIPLGVMSTYVIVFMIFAAFLDQSGIGKYLTNMAFGATRRARGGPAKATVLASAMVGSISGSGVANVATTGTFTIPLMKRSGYPPHMAGALEAAASNGGQIMPPVMAAAAFIMAETTGIPYVDIIVHATIPAILYFIAVFAAIHFIALRRELQPLSAAELEAVEPFDARRLYLLLPLGLLIWLLVEGFTPMYACVLAIATLVPITVLNREHRLTPARIVRALIAGTRNAVPIAVTCACAGLVIGTFSQTGLGFRFSQLIVDFSGGYLLAGLLMAMVTSIVLGMGMPTSAAYILISSLGAPALVELGATTISAHMFILYFAVMSAITPPIGLGAYAAAAIAGAGPHRTAWNACRLAAVAFVVPFIFVFHPELLFQGDPWAIVWSSVTAIVGAVVIAAALFGYFVTLVRLWERAALLAAALALIYPGSTSDLIGAALLAAVALVQFRRRGPDGTARSEGVG